MMKPIQKVMKLPRIKYYEAHLSIVNSLLPVKMTPKEIEVLARFMSLDGEIILDRFGTTARRLVRQDLNISDGGLANYLKSLKDKRLIRPSTAVTSKLEVFPVISVDAKQQDYQFRLIMDDSSEIPATLPTPIIASQEAVTN